MHALMFKARRSAIAEGTKYWVIESSWVPATSQRVGEGVPSDIKLFGSRREAIEFAAEWSGHPLYIRPIPGSFAVFEIRPKFVQIQAGWEVV